MCFPTSLLAWHAFLQPRPASPETHHMQPVSVTSTTLFLCTPLCSQAPKLTTSLPTRYAPPVSPARGARPGNQLCMLPGVCGSAATPILPCLLLPGGHSLQHIVQPAQPACLTTRVLPAACSLALSIVAQEGFVEAACWGSQARLAGWCGCTEVQPVQQWLPARVAVCCAPLCCALRFTAWQCLPSAMPSTCPTLQ